MSEFNEDELHAPSWLNEEFFADVLKKSEQNDSISVRELVITPGSNKGDHYGSVMFRAKVVYDTSDLKGNSLSLIIKTIPEADGIKKELLGDMHLFEAEIAMYSNTLPKFDAELRKIGDNTALTPKCYYHSLFPRKCLIFEDLVVMGYGTIKGRLANLEEAKAALLKLAKWHAVSYKLAAEGDTSITEYWEGFLCMDGIESMPFTSTGINNFIEIVETMDEFKTYIPKLRSLQKDLLQRTISSCKSYRQEVAKGIFVLCHGDFHSRNMMFKSHANGEVDAILFDLQIPFFGPAVYDVLYAIYMVFSDKLRTDHREELIYYYATNFIQSLETLKYEGEIPKVVDFYIDIIRYRHWELFLLSTFLPMVLGLVTCTLEPEKMMTSDQARRNVYNNPEYIKEVKRLLPIMLYQGYLD